MTLRMAGREEEGVDLIEHGRDRFLAIAIAPAIELAFEKIPRQRIGDASSDAGAKGRVGEKPRQQDERRVRRLEERRGRVAKDLLEPGAPHVDPDGAHAGNDPVGDDRAMIRCDVLEDVEADWIGAIGEIDIADLVVARGRHERQRLFGEVAMRVNDEESIAPGDVLADDVEEKGCLADARGAEDRHVAKALIARERHGLAVCRLTDMGMRGHSRDCLRGPRYGSWGNRLSARYAETTPVMDRRRLKRLRSPFHSKGRGRPVFMISCGEVRTLRSASLSGFGFAVQWEFCPRCRRRKIRRPPADYIFRAGRPRAASRARRGLCP